MEKTNVNYPFKNVADEVGRRNTLPRVFKIEGYFALCWGKNKCGSTG